MVFLGKIPGNRIKSLTYRNNAHALMLSYGEQSPIPGDKKIGLGCNSRTDHHIVIRVRSQTRNLSSLNNLGASRITIKKLLRTKTKVGNLLFELASGKNHRQFRQQRPTGAQLNIDFSYGSEETAWRALP